MGSECFSVNGCNVYNALVLFGDRLDLFGECRTLLFGFRKDVRERNAGLIIMLEFCATCEGSNVRTYRHVLGVGLWANLSNKRCTSGLDELGDGLLVEFLFKCVLSLIEGLVQDDRR